MSLTRRSFGIGVAALAAAPARAAEVPFVAALLGQMAALGDGPVLLNSYLIEPGARGDAFDLTQADAAYVYDNALAGLFLLAAGQRAAALRIGQALALAQAHDRKFTDGRLRNAYAAGVMSTPAKLPGFWDKKAGQWDEDPYQVGTDTGPMAWAMLLWVALGMKAPADNAGHFLDAALRAPSGYYGGFYGFDNAQQRLLWQSTEQNTDLAAAFRALGRPEDEAHAAAFVRAMYNAKTREFGSGTTPDGHKNTLLAADAGLWPYLAGLGDAASALAAINALQHGAGIGFSTASKGIWLEGTGFAALALRQMGNALAAQFLQTVRANVSPRGYVYATVAASMATGLSVGPALRKNQQEQAFTYYRRPALSATSWAGLAMLGVNPLAG